MTDKELILELAKRIGLKENDNNSTYNYEISKPNKAGNYSITFNEGARYSCFYVLFALNKEDKIFGYGVYE